MKKSAWLHAKARYGAAMRPASAASWVTTPLCSAAAGSRVKSSNAWMKSPLACLKLLIL